MSILTNGCLKLIFSLLWYLPPPTEIFLLSFTVPIESRSYLTLVFYYVFILEGLNLYGREFHYLNCKLYICNWSVLFICEFLSGNLLLPPIVLRFEFLIGDSVITDFYFDGFSILSISAYFDSSAMIRSRSSKKSSSNLLILFFIPCSMFYFTMLSTCIIYFWNSQLIFCSSFFVIRYVSIWTIWLKAPWSFSWIKISI